MTARASRPPVWPFRWWLPAALVALLVLGLAAGGSWLSFLALSLTGSLTVAAAVWAGWELRSRGRRAIGWCLLILILSPLGVICYLSARGHQGDAPAPVAAKPVAAWLVGLAFAVVAVVAVTAITSVLLVIPILVAAGLVAGGRLRLGYGLLIGAIVAPAIGAAIIGGFLVKVYRVPSPSMAPTLAVGDRVIALTAATPHVGDVVVFHPPASAMSPDAPTCGSEPANPSQLCDAPASGDLPAVVFLKRIVAGPGDTIGIHAGHVTRNGVALAEPYAAACPTGVPICDYAKPVQIPVGHWFVLGDNRPNSEDSRFWGPVATSWIVGVVSWRYWPLGQLGSL